MSRGTLNIQINHKAQCRAHVTLFIQSCIVKHDNYLNENLIKETTQEFYSHNDCVSYKLQQTP